MLACMNRIINLDVNNMHKQASRVVIVVLGFVFLTLRDSQSSNQTSVGSIWRSEMSTLSLEWNGARFHARALTTEAVGNP